MDGNNCRPTQVESSMDGGDWRTQLMPDSRERVVKKIMETLKRHLLIPGQEGLVEFRKIAARFEDKIYTIATSQSDYLRKISLKMLTVETYYQGVVNNSLPSNPGGNQNPLDAETSRKRRKSDAERRRERGTEVKKSRASMDSTLQTRQVGVVNWLEEVYQKIKSMEDMYLPELKELYQMVALKCQQYEVLGIEQSDPMEKLKYFKSMLERMITFLQAPKNNISPTYKEKLAQYEKQIIGALNSYRIKKSAMSQQPGQQQLQQSVGQSHSMTQ